MIRKSLVAALLVLGCALTWTARADDADSAAIIAAVDRAYVQGIHLDGDAEKVRSGMHESFIMFVRGENGLTTVTRDQWIARLKPREASAPRPNVKADITVLDHTTDAAVVKVALYRDGKQQFTDYISLYRFPEGWKLVGKIFQRH